MHEELEMQQEPHFITEQLTDLKEKEQHDDLRPALSIGAGALD